MVKNDVIFEGGGGGILKIIEDYKGEGGALRHPTLYYMILEC